MKALKTIIAVTILLFLTSTQQTQAQTKEETVKYISDLYSKGSEHFYKLSSPPSSNKTKGLSVTLDGKTLNVKYNDSRSGDNSDRISLINVALPLETYYFHSYYGVGIRNGKSILDNFSLKDDAERIKNALEHLIKIVQSEPDDDPFAP